MIDIRLVNGCYILTGPRCVVVLTRQQFIEALRRGKAYKRAEALG
jgi:hypothetical protein